MSKVYDEGMDIDMLANTLSCIECELEEKADNYAKMMQYIKRDSEALKEEAERLLHKAKVLEKKEKFLRETLEQSMRITGKTNFKTLLFHFSIQKNGGQRKLRIDIPVSQIPEEYLIPQEPKPNKEAIKKALETQHFSWAHLQEQGEHLTIR